MSDFTGEEQARPSRPQRSSRSASQQKPMTYSVKKDFPTAKPDVTLVFEGLLWFIFHGKDECQVGIHNSTQGTFFPHRHPHELGLTVWEIVGCAPPTSCTSRTYPIGNPKTIAGIHIDVNNPVDEGVYVFQKEPFDRLDNVKSHPKDWRWVLDFDGDLLYPDGVKLDAERINPGVFINHGLFYTLHKTNSTFSLISEYDGDEYEIGNVAQYVGGNIYLKDPGDDVTIRIRHTFPAQSPPITLKKKVGVCYQVDITNLCVKNGTPCHFRPDHTSKKERNDFYLYYDTCATPGSADEYLLKRKLPYPPSTPEICFSSHKKQHIDSSNDAPCGPVGAGRGGGG